MAWTDGANGRGVDSKGHSCGPGDYAAIKAAGFAAFDGLNDEIYPDDALVDGSLLCLENGAIVACRKSANFRVSIATGSLDAAELVMETLQAVAAAKSAAAPAPAAALSAGEQADLDAMAWLRKSLIANGIS